MSAGDWKDMFAAAVEGDLPRVRHHIQGGVDPNYQHPEIQCTALVASLIEGHDAVARYLLDHGANPHLLSEFDALTPLQAARKHGRAALAELLQERGARDVPAVRAPFWQRWLPV